jgi:hypothetical protein
MRMRRSRRFGEGRNTVEAPVMPPAEETREFSRWENEELDILAFELWQRASCPDTPIDVDLLEEWYHATCL